MSLWWKSRKLVQSFTHRLAVERLELRRYNLQEILEHVVLLDGL